MSNVRNFIGGTVVDNDEAKADAIETLESMLEDMKAGKITSFAAVGIAANRDTAFYSGGYGENHTVVVTSGAIWRLLQWIGKDS